MGKGVAGEVEGGRKRMLYRKYIGGVWKGQR